MRKEINSFKQEEDEPQLLLRCHRQLLTHHMHTCTNDEHGHVAVEETNEGELSYS
jgi:hypothetical protein